VRRPSNSTSCKSKSSKPQRGLSAPWPRRSASS
jgi:hypothetical protein